MDHALKAALAAGDWMGVLRHPDANRTLYAVALERALDECKDNRDERMSLLLEFGSDERLNYPGMLKRLRPYLLAVPVLTRVALYSRWRRSASELAKQAERAGLARPAG
jgi:hypothetical protein